jgi:hypothetical protein
MAKPTAPVAPTYYDRMTSGPVSSECAASNMHYLTDAGPVIYGLKRIRDNHADKFTAEEIETLAVARRILERAEVPRCLIEVAPRPKLRRLKFLGI